MHDVTYVCTRVRSIGYRRYLYICYADTDWYAVICNVCSLDSIPPVPNSRFLFFVFCWNNFVLAYHIMLEDFNDMEKYKTVWNNQLVSRLEWQMFVLFIWEAKVCIIFDLSQCQDFFCHYKWDCIFNLFDWRRKLDDWLELQYNVGYGGLAKGPGVVAIPKRLD